MAQLIRQRSEQEPSFSVRKALVSFFRHFDWLQVLVAALLFGCGILFVYGIGQQQGGGFTNFWVRQLHFGIAGIVCFILLSFVDYRNFGILSVIGYPFIIGLLICTLVFGKRSGGAVRWFYGIQPSEIAKFVVIIAVAWILSRKVIYKHPVWTVFGAIAAAALPMFLIALQPHLSTVIIIGTSISGMIFVAPVRLKYLFFIFLCGLMVAPCGYFLLQGYHKQRVDAYLHPTAAYSRTINYAPKQAVYAIGSGGFSGKGYMRGTQHSFGYIPKNVVYNDYIFSVVGEEFGFVGAAGLMGLYILLLITLFRTAVSSDEIFARQLCAGTAMMISAHTILHIGTCLRIIPPTGVPLPLVSYGGTFMIIVFAFLGISQNIYAVRCSSVVSDENSGDADGGEDNDDDE